MSEIIEKIKEELETNSSEEQIISRINELIKEYNAHKSTFSDDENCRYKFNFQTRENNKIEEFLNSSSEVELYKDTIIFLNITKLELICYLICMQKKSTQKIFLTTLKKK